MIVKIPSIKENVAVVESFIENAGEKIKIKESQLLEYNSNFQFSLILVLALNLSRLLFITILNYRMPSNNLV